MSGGRWEYVQYYMVQIAEDLESLIPKSKGKVKDVLSLMAKRLRKDYELLNALDYFLCGDTGEEELFDAFDGVDCE